MYNAAWQQGELVRVTAIEHCSVGGRKFLGVAKGEDSHREEVIVLGETVHALTEWCSRLGGEGLLEVEPVTVGPLGPDARRSHAQVRDADLRFCLVGRAEFPCEKSCCDGERVVGGGGRHRAGSGVGREKSEEERAKKRLHLGERIVGGHRRRCKFRAAFIYSPERVDAIRVPTTGRLRCALSI